MNDKSVSQLDLTNNMPTYKLILVRREYVDVYVFQPNGSSLIKNELLY